MLVVMRICFCYWPFAKMTSWFYQSVVQLLGHWPYAFQHFCCIAAMNIWSETGLPAITEIAPLTLLAGSAPAVGLFHLCFPPWQKPLVCNLIFFNNWFREVMGRVKTKFFEVLDKYEYWKGKCVKSVLGEFSSGVSIRRNKGTQSDLGPLFAPLAGGYRGLSSGSVDKFVVKLKRQSSFTSARWKT